MLLAHTHLGKPQMRPLLLISSACLLGTSVFAQTVPNAGSILQEIERSQEQPAPARKKSAELISPPAELVSPGGLSVTVKEFHFDGNHLISSEKLDAVLNSFRDRPLDFNGLNVAVAAVVQAYQNAGWVVRAYLPEQDIQDGIVTIQIIESVFGGVHTIGEVKGRVSAEVVRQLFETQQKIGEPLSAEAINRALLLADDLPGVTVSGSLRAGAKVGETDIDLQLGDEPFVLGSVGADNTGSRSIGPYRETANLNFNSPLEQGDLENLNLMHSQGSNYVRAEVTLPVGYDGWRVGFNGSNMKYELVALQFSALNAGGSSNTFGLSTTYPIIRANATNLRLSLNVDKKAFDNYSSGATTTRYQDDLISIGFDGNSFDGFSGGGSNNYNLSLVRGNLNLNGSPNQAADATTTHIQGDFVKARFGASRQQMINDDLAFFGAISGQWANKNLDSSEKFYLGGSNGVRAYPMNEGGGADGGLLNLELRYLWAPGVHLTGFYDYGHIKINPDNGFANASPLNQYSLKGSGLSLEWRSDFGTNVKATWSRRIGSNPNPTATGTDQDGSLTINRFWLTVEQLF